MQRFTGNPLAVLPLVATLGLVLTACAGSSNDDGGTGSGSGSSSLGAEDGCLRLCDVYGRCEGELILDDDCLSACLPAIEPYGDAGTALVNGCADCLDRSGCDGLADGGACDAACGGTEGLGGGSGSGSGSGGSSSDTSCESTFTLPEGDAVVRCECYEPHDCYCDCFVAGVYDAGFASNDFCDVGSDARRDRAGRGCRWPELR